MWTLDIFLISDLFNSIFQIQTFYTATGLIIDILTSKPFK